MILLASLVCAIQQALGLLEAPPSLRLSLLENGGSPHRLGAELLPQAKEFNYLRVLFK